MGPPSQQFGSSRGDIPGYPGLVSIYEQVDLIRQETLRRCPICYYHNMGDAILATRWSCWGYNASIAKNFLWLGCRCLSVRNEHPLVQGYICIFG